MKKRILILLFATLFLFSAKSVISNTNSLDILKDVFEKDLGYFLENAPYLNNSEFNQALKTLKLMDKDKGFKEIAGRRLDDL